MLWSFQTKELLGGFPLDIVWSCTNDCGLLQICDFHSFLAVKFVFCLVTDCETVLSEVQLEVQYFRPSNQNFRGGGGRGLTTGKWQLNLRVWGWEGGVDWQGRDIPMKLYFLFSMLIQMCYYFPGRWWSLIRSELWAKENIFRQHVHSVKLAVEWLN